MDLSTVTSLQSLLEIATAGVTAVSTLVLAVLTWVLARATRQMAIAASAPNVIASLELNQWSIRHLDLVITNTGSAPAYNIDIEFSPSIEAPEFRNGKSLPFGSISLLRPGQQLVSAVCEHKAVKDWIFTIEVRWKRSPKSKSPEVLRYDLDLSYLKDVTILGERDPEVQIASIIKEIREDWRPIATGSRRAQTDVYTKEDRDAVKAKLEKEAEKRRGADDRR